MLKTSIYSIKSGPNQGRYAGYVVLPHEKGDKREKKTVYGKNEKEVMQKIGKLITEIENGDYIKPNKSYFINFLKEYHKVCAGYDIWNPKTKKIANAKWEQTTAELYKMYIDKHFEPYFKNIKLIEVKPMLLDTFYNYKLSEVKYVKIKGSDNKKEVPKMTINTVIKLNKFLKAAFNYAIANGMIRSNPTNKVILGKKEKYNPVIYDNEQFLKLVDYVKDKYDRVPIALGAGMGFRRGEIFGLTWNDIDFENKTISVNKSVVRFIKEIEKSPKNETSNRTIVGPDYVFDILKDYKAEVNPINDNEKILSVSPAYYSHRFNWLLEHFDLPHTRLHDLRHYNAVVMMEKGIPDKVAAERLGHSGVATLRNVYQHVINDMDKKAAEEINKAFK